MLSNRTSSAMMILLGLTLACGGKVVAPYELDADGGEGSEDGGSEDGGVAGAGGSGGASGSLTCGEQVYDRWSLSCACDWTCSDGNTYAFECRLMGQGAYSCDCYVNGEVEDTCGVGGSSNGPPYDACDADCCEFPKSQ